MNLILLDYDVFDSVETIKNFFEKEQNCTVSCLQDNDFINEDKEIPIRAIFVTKLNSGWLRYHSELFEKFPNITHWIFCILGNVGDALKQTIANGFSNIVFESDNYCELIFDTEQFETLLEKMQSPIKTKKKCLVISWNLPLAESVSSIIKGYLSGWDVEYCLDPENSDYSMCDKILVVGNVIEEMVVSKPENLSAEVLFWINRPYYTDARIVEENRKLLIEKLNEKGWNISNCSSKFFLSGIHNEVSYQRFISNEMMLVALLPDPEFVMWDNYGLPTTQGRWEDNQILSFLEDNTVFKEMADGFCKEK